MNERKPAHLSNTTINKKMVTYRRKPTENTIAFGQNPVGCWVSGVSAAIMAGRLDFWWRVMEKNEFARASVAPWSRQIQRTKKWRAVPKYQTSQHFARKKKGWDTVLSSYVATQTTTKFWRMQDNSRKHREKSKIHVLIFYSYANIFYHNSNISNASTERSIHREFHPRMQ